ncbi:hypothetical protein UFOVP810_38 [uncultured Caudovirales phage]|uniref:Uncharacterized protein n=1 Tax=uncultured Caudovirales phage TaxID=2100421 RepID=A0A6J5P2R9_9CAUD|nr:hypothetical protein UFOVP810_38 [uncultured Caudovirales phage]
MKLKRGIIGAKSTLLAAPNYLSPTVTYTRTGIATGVTPTNDTYEVAANVPRYNAVGDLIWEGQRTNLVVNPRWEGAVAGTPGTLPSSTGTFIAPTGITREVVGVTTVNGAAEYQVRFAGTPSSTGEITVYPLPAATAAATGANVVTAVQARIVAGSLTNITSVSLRVLEYLGVAYVREGALAISLTASRTSFSFVRTMGAGVDSAIIAYTIIGVAGQPMDITLGLALPEVELAPFSSSAILPPIGAPAISTRGADTGRFNVTPTGSIVFAARPGQAAPTGFSQVFMSVNDGFDSNRWDFVCVPGGNDIRLQRVVANIGSNTASLGTQVPGTMIYCAMSWDSVGNGAAKTRGGTYRTIASGPTGMTGGRLGNRISGLASLFGSIAYVAVLPNRYLTEAEMDVELAKLVGYT